MNYFKKYLKYKKKYLNLKGGAGLMFIPSEIQYNTNTLFMLDNIHRLVGNYIPENIIINTNGTNQFQQDPAIFLKIKDDINDYAIQVKEGLDLETNNFQVLNVPFENGNDFGGNFISSPFTTSSNGCVFYFGNININLLHNLQTNLSQNLVELSCNFKYNGERHIDECMCFMPYGNEWKIWIYYINEVKLSNYLQSLESTECNYNELIDFLIKISEKNTPDDKKEIIFEIVRYYRREIEFINISDQFIKWINKKLLPPQIKCLEKILNKSETINIEHIKNLLKEEHIYNLNLISHHLFGRDFTFNRDKFVLFPIDLEMTSQNNFKITSPPIFNRVIYENDQNLCILFSKNDDKNFDVHTLELLKSETKKIKSIIDPNKSVHIAEINTTLFANTESNIGGNLHCLIKNKY